jgi:putative restriction endonuclease
MEKLSQYIDRFYNLRVGVTGQGKARHERPHKPVMLMAVMDLIASGVIRKNRINWSEELLSRFGEIFEKVSSSNDQPSPENPFFYLKSDGFWHHIAKTGQESVVENLSKPPRIGDLASGLFHVELDSDLFDLLAEKESRVVFQEAGAS